MSTKTSLEPKQTIQGQQKLKSLEELKTNEVPPVIQSIQKVSKTLQKMQNRLESQIENGDFTVGNRMNLSEMMDESEESEVSSSRTINKINTNQSNMTMKSRNSNSNLTQKGKEDKKNFYISSNPEIVKEKYELFQLIREQYSHNQNLNASKEIEPLVKSWMKQQKLLDQKRQKFLEKQSQQSRIIEQRQKEEERKSLEKKYQEHKLEVLDKIELRKWKKSKQKQIRQMETISKQILKQNKPPLFKEKEIKFIEKQRIQQNERQAQLEERKHFLAHYNTQAIKQHRLKAIQQLKKQKQQSQQKSKSKSPTHQRKLRTETSSLIHSRSQQFITTRNDRILIQQEEQKKRQRIKEYVERLKSMSPDQSTLERIKKVNEDIMSSQKLLKESKVKRVRKNGEANAGVKSRVRSLRNLMTGPKKQFINESLDKAERVKLGNMYFNEQKKYMKVLTESRTQRIDENPQESSSFQHQNNLLTANKKTESRYKKAKTEDSQHTQRDTNSYKIKAHPSSSKLPQPSSQPLVKRLEKPSRSSSTLLINPSIYEPKPAYKNYLPQIKLKLVSKPQTQLQKLKQSLNNNPAEILREFSKRSSEIEQNLMRKIGEFRKIQKSEKYEKSLLKQKEIDQLYYKNLQVKLACLDAQ